MQLFREAINECGFLDLGFIGSQFTWQNFFADGHLVWERLNRALANNEWLLRFAGTRVHHLTCNSLDHCPLWIAPDGIEILHSLKQFRFEEMWPSDKGCTKTIEAVWSSHDCLDLGTRVVHKIEKWGKELKRWSWLNFGNIKSEMAEKKKRQIVEVEKEAHKTGNNFQLWDLKMKLNILLDKETWMWFQRAKAL